MNLFRRQVLKLKLIKLTNDIHIANCYVLTKQFNNVYKMVDNNYNFEHYSVNCWDVEESFDRLSDDKLDKAEEMLKLF